MRQVEFTPEKSGFLSKDQLKFWKKWKRKAASKKRQAMERWKENPDVSPELDGSVWSELKSWLLSTFFHGKCAYCETHFEASSWGDAEHYRPKGMVTVSTEEGEVQVNRRGGKPHPGYFWLAYDWRNLLPACQRCNSTGKGTLFPIANEKRHSCNTALSVNKLNELEQPLLLHPYEHNPTQDLEFLSRGGIRAREGSQRGQMSIDTYLLDRSELNTAREGRQEDAENAFLEAVRCLVKEGKPIEQSMRKYTGQEAPYTTSVKAFLALKESQILSQIGSE